MQPRSNAGLLAIRILTQVERDIEDLAWNSA
jgi:hypothetical protein